MADDWANYWDLRTAIKGLPQPLNEQRLRLWVVGCCRLILDRSHSHPRLVAARVWFTPANISGWEREVSAAERFSCGQTDARTMLDARNPTTGGPHNVFRAASWVSRFNPDDVHLVLSSFSREFGVPTPDELSALLHDVFGNPRKPPVIEPAWKCSTVVGLAEGIYAGRAFDRMPILADALEEAGCDNADILAHCRGPGPHARGCWVVDAVLGKG